MTTGQNPLLRARFGGEAGAASTIEEPTIDRILSRGSIRRYDPQPVPPEVVRSLLAAALSASSKSDLQQVSIIHLSDPTRRRAVADLIPAMAWIADAPELFVFCGDTHRIERIGGLRGDPIEAGTFESLFNATVDAALALQTFILAAEAVGLGTCPISAVRSCAASLAELLDLPSKVFPVAGLAVGYPATPATITPRLPSSLTVHENRYDDTGLLSAIDAYDTTRAHHAGNPPGHLPWSEFKIRQASTQDGGSFIAFLRTSGFDTSLHYRYAAPPRER